MIQLAVIVGGLIVFFIIIIMALCLWAEWAERMEDEE